MMVGQKAEMMVLRMAGQKADQKAGLSVVMLDWLLVDLMVEGKAETWVEAMAAQMAVRSVVQMAVRSVGRRVVTKADYWVARQAAQMAEQKAAEKAALSVVSSEDARVDRTVD